MADNLGPMAWLFLPENVQVQYLQKIALRAENPSGPKSNSEKRRKDEKDEKWINRSRIIRIQRISVGRRGGRVRYFAALSADNTDAGPD